MRTQGFSKEVTMMERKNIWMLFCIIGLYLFTPQQCCAQSGANSVRNSSNQEQIVQEILSEVRQLRIEVQRLKANAYQTQVVIERLRLQQDHVSRLTGELGEVREKLGETQALQVKMNGTLEETQKQVEAGVISQSELKKISGEIEELKRREERLTEQESQLSAELNAERVKLITLNKQLDELGQETTGAGVKKD
jgi:predicted  nucleic acid-binding Zn-ribbon protein